MLCVINIQQAPTQLQNENEVQAFCVLNVTKVFLWESPFLSKFIADNFKRSLQIKMLNTFMKHDIVMVM